MNLVYLIRLVCLAACGATIWVYAHEPLTLVPLLALTMSSFAAGVLSVFDMGAAEGEEIESCGSDDDREYTHIGYVFEKADFSIELRQSSTDFSLDEIGFIRPIYVRINDDFSMQWFNE